MNKIVIGLADKTEALYTKQGFLLIDDGPAMASFTRWSGTTVRPCWRNPIWTISTGRRVSIRRPASRSTTIQQGYPDLCGHRHAHARQSHQKDVSGSIRWKQFLARNLQPKDQATLHPDRNACGDLTRKPEHSNKAAGWRGGTYQQTERFESNLTVADPLTGEVKKTVHVPYPNYSGTLSTGGGLVYSPDSPMGLSRPTTTPRWISSGRLTSEPASTRRR